MSSRNISSVFLGCLSLCAGERLTEKVVLQALHLYRWEPLLLRPNRWNEALSASTSSC